MLRALSTLRLLMCLCVLAQLYVLGPQVPLHRPPASFPFSAPSSSPPTPPSLLPPSPPTPPHSPLASGFDWTVDGLLRELRGRPLEPEARITLPYQTAEECWYRASTIGKHNTMTPRCTDTLPRRPRSMSSARTCTTIVASVTPFAVGRGSVGDCDFDLHNCHSRMQLQTDCSRCAS